MTHLPGTPCVLSPSCLKQQSFDPSSFYAVFLPCWKVSIVFLLSGVGISHRKVEFFPLLMRKHIYLCCTHAGGAVGEHIGRSIFYCPRTPAGAKVTTWASAKRSHAPGTCNYLQVCHMLNLTPRFMSL